MYQHNYKHTNNITVCLCLYSAFGRMQIMQQLCLSFLVFATTASRHNATKCKSAVSTTITTNLQSNLVPIKAYAAVLEASRWLPQRACHNPFTCCTCRGAYATIYSYMHTHLNIVTHLHIDTSIFIRLLCAACRMTLSRSLYGNCNRPICLSVCLSVGESVVSGKFCCGVNNVATFCVPIHLAVNFVLIVDLHCIIVY